METNRTNAPQVQCHVRLNNFAVVEKQAHKLRRHITHNSNEHEHRERRARSIDLYRAQAVCVILNLEILLTILTNVANAPHSSHTHQEFRPSAASSVVGRRVSAVHLCIFVPSPTAVRRCVRRTRTFYYSRRISDRLTLT